MGRFAIGNSRVGLRVRLGTRTGLDQNEVKIRCVAGRSNVCDLDLHETEAGLVGYVNNPYEHIPLVQFFAVS